MRSFLESIDRHERALLAWIGSGEPGLYLRDVSEALSSPWNLVIIVAILALYRAVRSEPLIAGKRDWITLALLLLAVGLGDLTGLVLKQLVQRPRPCFFLAADPGVCANLHFSFPSNHAVNTFSAATVLGARSPRWRWPLFGFAALIGVFRVSSGAHYPSDVIAGAACGVAIGGAFVGAGRRLFGWQPRPVKNFAAASPEARPG